MQAELVIPDSFRSLIVEHSSRPLDFQAELWPGKWTAEGTVENIAVVGFAQGSSGQELG